MSRPLEEIQDEVLDRLHAGEDVDRSAVLARHPFHAEALRRFFKLLDVVEAPPSPAPLTPSRLGDFEIQEEIGRGGMGVVYRARQISLGRPVALKVLPPSLREDRRLLSRFRREAEAAGRLRHPNIVPVYTVGESAGISFYSMELVEGRSLAEVLKRRRAGDDPGLPPAGVDWTRWCTDTAACVAGALDYAHGRGILHRDVKPGNILLELDGTPRLTDFGLALDMEATGLTVSGEVFGSPLYMSPEQAFRKDHPLDARTDVYSLGVTLYEMLLGRLPYAGTTNSDVLSALNTGSVVRPREVDPQLPEALERILLCALQNEASARYDSAAAMARDLSVALQHPEQVLALAGQAPSLSGPTAQARAGGGHSTHSAPGPGALAPPTAGHGRRSTRRRKRVRRVLIALGCLILITVIGGWLLTRLTYQRSLAAQRSLAGAAEQARRAAWAPSLGGQGEVPPAPVLVDLTTDGLTDIGGESTFERWLRPGWTMRRVVGREDPGTLRLEVSLAIPGDMPYDLLVWGRWELYDERAVATEHGHIRPPALFRGEPWAYLLAPGTESTLFREYELVDVLGERLSADSIRLKPRLELHASRSSDAGNIKRPARMASFEVSMRSPPTNGASTVWWGAEQTAFVYDEYPADYPLPVSSPLLDAEMEHAFKPTSIEYVRNEVLDDGAKALVFRVHQLKHGGGPLPAAMEVDLYLDDADKPLGTATLVQGAAPTRPAGSQAAQDGGGTRRLTFRLDPDAAATEQAAVARLDRGADAMVRLVYRPARQLALRESDFFEYWAGRMEVLLQLAGR